jgi:hypothetical protein
MLGTFEILIWEEQRMCVIGHSVAHVSSGHYYGHAAPQLNEIK